MTTACHRCGRELEDNAFGRQDRCPGCESDTRCCRNCAFEEPGYRSECRETQAEPIHDFESSNSCDYFRPRRGPARTPARPQGPKSRSAFDALFRKGPPAGPRRGGVDDPS